MDDFKISMFENENNRRFPLYRSLSGNECRLLIQRITQIYKLDQGNIESLLASRQSFYDKTNALDDDFSLLTLLRDLEIKPAEDIYINWFKFDKIDILNGEDLNKYFNDIWFQSSDDIDLFDNSLEWTVSIRHDGCVSFIKR